MLLRNAPTVTTPTKTKDDSICHERHRLMHAAVSSLRAPRSSGNRAFDEYRAETLRRLEEEQREFRDFLDRLRHAKDKAEFDQFMAERRNRPPETSRPPEPQPQSH